MSKQWQAVVREVWKNESGHIYAIGRYYCSVEQAQMHWAERVVDGREPNPDDRPEYEML